MEQYMKVLKSYKRMPRGLEDHIRSNVKSVKFPKASTIQKEGILCDHIYFIEKGVVKVFDSRGTYSFLKENEFILGHYEDTSLNPEFRSLYEDAPGIKALEEITAWDFTSDMIASTSKLFPEFQGYIATMFMKGLINLNRINSLLGGHDKAALLLDFLRRDSPTLLERLDPKEIALFLGVTEEVCLHIMNSKVRTPGSGKHLRRHTRR